MESLTKFRQDTDTLQRMLDAAFGPEAAAGAAATASEMGHGWCNVAYGITLADGRGVVTKIAPPPGVEVMSYERDMMAGEIAALRLIAERTNVPVPAVLHADTSHAIIDADWFVMDLVPGENLGIIEPELPPEVATDYWRQLGAANAELNAMVGPAFGRFDTELVPTWREAFTQILHDVLDDGERLDVRLPWSYDEIRETIAEHASVLDAVTQPQFCEWDLWSSNVLVADGRIQGVIDHERAFWGDPVMEAGISLTTMPVPWGLPDAFLEGYGRGPLDADELARRRLYDLHLFLIMYIETYYRGHTDEVNRDIARPLLAAAMTALGHPPQQG